MFALWTPRVLRGRGAWTPSHATHTKVFISGAALIHHLQSQPDAGGGPKSLDRRLLEAFAGQPRPHRAGPGGEPGCREPAVGRDRAAARPSASAAAAWPGDGRHLRRVGPGAAHPGGSGAGKTTLLLELARDLLDRAAQDAAHPIPVVFHLSSWAVRRRPLADWLVDELAERYYVPRKLAQAWINADQVLPLLDGLDEVAPEHRAACVEAINTFRATGTDWFLGRVQSHGGLRRAAGARRAVRGGGHRTALAGADQHST